MPIYSYLTLILTLSFDAFLTSLAYGMKQIRIPAASKLAIAALPALLSFAVMTAALQLETVLSFTHANLIGAFILFFIAGMTLKEVNKERKQEKQSGKNPFHILADPPVADTNANQVLQFKESLMVGLAVSIDGGAMSLSFALEGESPLITAALVLLSHMLMIIAGEALAKRPFVAWLADRCRYLPVFIFLAIGISRLFT